MSVHKVWHENFRGYLPDGYRLIEHQLRKPVSWCPTFVMLCKHKIRRVDYPVHWRPAAIERDNSIIEGQPENPMLYKGADGVRIHLASLSVFDMPTYSWHDGVVREIIRAVNVSEMPGSRAHDFYIYDQFVIHENWETNWSIRWKPVGRGQWETLKSVEDIKP